MTRALMVSAAIRRLNAAMLQGASDQEIRKIVVEEALSLTGAATAALGYVSSTGDALDFVSAVGENAKQVLGLKIRISESLSERVIRTGQPALIDARAEPETGSLFAELATSSPVPPPAIENRSLPRTAAVAPIFRNGKTIGTLSALNKQGEPETGSPYSSFDAEDLDALLMLAEQVELTSQWNGARLAVRDQDRELAALYEISQTVAGSLNLQQAMESVLGAISARLENHSATILLLNDEKTHLFIVADRGLNDEERETQLSVSEGVQARALSTGLSLMIADTEDEPDFADFSERAHARSAIYVPIRSREETYGLIVVTSMQRNAYAPNDLRLLEAVSQQAGIAIENSYLYEDAQRRADQAQSLYNLSARLSETLQIERVMEHVAENAMEMLNADRFALLMHSASKNRLVPRVSRTRRGDDPAFAEAVQPSSGEGIAGWVFEYLTPASVTDIVADSRNRSCPVDGFDVASTLCVPMQVNEEAIGVMQVFSEKRRLFTVPEMELLYTIANLASGAVANALLYEESRSSARELRRYFRRIATTLGDSLEKGNLPQLMLKLTVEALQATRGAIYRIEDDVLKLVADTGYRASLPALNDIPMGEGVAGWIAKRGQSVAAVDVTIDARATSQSTPSKTKPTGYLGAPLKLGRQTVGVIELYTDEPREFTRDEIRLLSSFVRRSQVAERIASHLNVQ